MYLCLHSISPCLPIPFSLSISLSVCLYVYLSVSTLSLSLSLSLSLYVVPPSLSPYLSIPLCVLLLLSLFFSTLLPGVSAGSYRWGCRDGDWFTPSKYALVVYCTHKMRNYEPILITFYRMLPYSFFFPFLCLNLLLVLIRGRLCIYSFRHISVLYLLKFIIQTETKHADRVRGKINVCGLYLCVGIELIVVILLIIVILSRWEILIMYHCKILIYDPIKWVFDKEDGRQRRSRKYNRWEVIKGL